MPVWIVSRNLLVAWLLLFGGSAQAAYYSVVDGELVGALEVDVAGELFDVSFGNGSCIDLYTGCDELTDLPFADPVESQLAVTALLTQVFGNGDSYATDPTLTRGCGSPVCFLMMPYAFSSNADYPGWIQVKGGRNTTSLSDNTVGFSMLDPSFDISAYPSWTYTQWTPSLSTTSRLTPVSAVPLPAALWLFGSALLWFAGLARRRNRR